MQSTSPILPLIEYRELICHLACRALSLRTTRISTLLRAAIAAEWLPLTMSSEQSSNDGEDDTHQDDKHDDTSKVHNAPFKKTGHRRREGGDGIIERPPRRLALSRGSLTVTQQEHPTRLPGKRRLRASWTNLIHQTQTTCTALADETASFWVELFAGCSKRKRKTAKSANATIVKGPKATSPIISPPI